MIAALVFFAGVATGWLICHGVYRLDFYEADIDREWLERQIHLIAAEQEERVPIDWLDDLDAIKRLPERDKPFDWEAA